MNYPSNVYQCHHPSCVNTDTTPCVFTDYAPRIHPIRVYVEWLGLRGATRHLWRLWRNRWADFPPEYYCPEHAYEEGFCWGCGNFWAGCEDFDFHPSHLCSDCRVDLSDYDDYEDEWLADWAMYPGELLASDIDFESNAQ